MTNKIAIFYHLMQAPGWERMYQDQMHTLYSSGLMSRCEFVNIGVNGNENLFYTPPRAIVNINSFQPSEYDTLKRIEKFSLDTLCNYKILYFHSKGMSRTNHLNSQWWRLYMEHYLIREWKKCIRFLDKYDCAGASYFEDTYVGFYPHFSGNFWWANSNYIKKLDTSYLSQENRQKTEFWICSNFNENKPKIKSLSPFTSCHYANAHTPDKYIDLGNS